MGFDIECILDIHTYPGEYFCPVCRTLVYPNEALQSQCTHLYCKLCLAHVANGTKACPYDGYLVTESDSKPLMESDKALAENIGKVKVHCLFFRSGCTWEGALSDCTTHCSACSFGNSPVICNRCGIQIVHRQVHDHAQTCPGGYEAQQAVGGVSGTASSTTTAEMNRTISQSGAALPQAQNSQNAVANLVPVQNSNQQVNASSNTQVVTPGAVPTPDNWYQQQYQQYYQQYAGYESYQQLSHQYYPHQQQPFQQYQQHSVPVQGQHQSHVHTLNPPQAQTQPQAHAQLQQHQPHLVPQTPQQPNHQPQAQGQVQPQAQAQVPGQAQQQPQVQLPQAQLQGQPQVHAPIQASAPNYQVNPQQQPLPPVHSQAHSLPHTVPPPPPHGQQAPYAQGMGMQPHTQRPHVPHFQPPPFQMHHPQASQTHVQPQVLPQQPLPLPPPPPPPLAQTSNQSHGQAQPQAHQYHTQSQPHFRPPQPNHPSIPASLSHVPHTPVPPVSGHHSYQQHQPAQQLQSGLSQQHPVYPYPAGGTSHPVNGQAPQQPVVMRPPHSFASLPQQQSTTVMQSLVPGIPPVHQQFPSHVQQPSHPLQHRPPVQPIQQAVAQQYAQQPFLPPYQGHVHQQIHFPQQQPMQPPRPYAPPHSQPSQNYVGRPAMPHPGMPPQPNLQSSGGAGPVPPSDPAHVGLKQTSRNQNNADSTMPEQNATKQEIRSPSKGLIEMGSEVVSVKTESDGGQHETAVKNADNAVNDGLVKPFIKREEGGLDSGGRPSETGIPENKQSSMLTDSDAMKQAGLDNQEVKLPKAVVRGPSSPNFGEESCTSVSASSAEGHVQPPKSHGTHQQRPQAHVPGPPPSIAGPVGPGIVSHPGQSFNPTEGRGSGYLGPPPKSFESPFPQGPSLAGSADPRGITGRAPQPRFEGQFGPQHSVRPSDTAILKDQRPVEGGNFRQTYGNESSFLRMNGSTAPETPMFGLRDEKMKPFSGERMNSFLEPTQMLDQGSIGKAPHGPNNDPGSKFDPSLGSHSRFFPPQHPVMHGRMDDFGTGPGFGQFHMKHLAPRSPDREYRGISPRGLGGPSIFPRDSSAFDDVNGREVGRFGEGSRYFNQSLDHGNPFQDGRFPPLPGHLRRGEMDGPESLRFGEHMAPRPHQSYNRSDDAFVKDGPGHLMRGEFSGPGYFSGHMNTAETTGPGAFHGHARATELGGPGNFPGMWNNHSVQGFPNAANFAGGLDFYDSSRKRRPISTGWCRICKVDFETVEGLDMHSQTREHQKTTMDMVKSIKQQNRKKQRSSGGHNAHEGGRARKVGLEYRGNKP